MASMAILVFVLAPCVGTQTGSNARLTPPLPSGAEWRRITTSCAAATARPVTWSPQGATTLYGRNLKFGNTGISSPRCG
jgi:hypothetical protein